MNTPTPITFAVTIIYTLAYVATYIYQHRKIKALEAVTKSQSTLITDFEKYKSFFSVEDFEKRLTMKLQNQKDELQSNFNKEFQQLQDNAIQAAVNVFQRETANAMAAWEELVQIAVAVTVKQYPNPEDKSERDLHIKQRYPKNAHYFIGFIDEYLVKKNEETK